MTACTPDDGNDLLQNRRRERHDQRIHRPERPLGVSRDSPAAPGRVPTRGLLAPLIRPTSRDFRARNPLSQKRVRTPQHANAPAGKPGRSLLTVRRAGFAHAHRSHAAFGR